jgi:hypothetical protein
MKWQYRLFDFSVPDSTDDVEMAENQLNGFGSEGWEAVSAWMEGDKAIFVLFKKPISK